MIATEILRHFHNGEISHVVIDKDTNLHGEKATKVVATLSDGRTVEGLFTSHPRAGFGGVDFAGPKDIVGLMISKIKSVLGGTAE